MEKKLGAIAIGAFAAIFLAAPLAAQNTQWQIDPDQSTARLYIDSALQPGGSVNSGVAPVTGTMTRTGPNPADFTLNFSVAPAYMEQTSQPSAGKAQYLPFGDGYLAMTFQSTQVVPLADGGFRAVGQLTWTYVERNASYDPDESYAGPVYGPAVVHTEQQNVAFKISTDRSISGSRNFAMTASGQISATNSAEFARAMASPSWPGYIAGEGCAMLSATGEDYAGPSCTGVAVDLSPPADMQCAMPAAGEDFSGEICERARAGANSGLNLPGAAAALNLDLHLRVAGGSVAPGRD